MFALFCLSNISLILLFIFLILVATRRGVYNNKQQLNRKWCIPMASILSPNPNDPRVIRTRQLILDSFLEQLHHMDFDTITIGDITKQATINRATFYAHFPDKYALLETMFSDTFLQLVIRKVDSHINLTEEMIYELVMALCEYHDSSMTCIKKYDSVSAIMEENIRTQLEKFILQLITQEHAHTDQNTLTTAATMISWAIYGAAYQWKKNNQQQSPSDLAERVVPIVMGGLHILHSTQKG